jgi:hypothetical protein
MDWGYNHGTIRNHVKDTLLARQKARAPRGRGRAHLLPPYPAPRLTEGKSFFLFDPPQHCRVSERAAHAQRGGGDGSERDPSEYCAPPLPPPLADAQCPAPPLGGPAAAPRRSF